MSKTELAGSRSNLGNYNEKCPPLFRWAGGKRRLLTQILPLVPKNYGCYFEPLCGGAALFFELRPAIATLADKNAELINCYRQVKNHPEEVIAALQKLTNTKDDYYKVRENIPGRKIDRAARFFYLMSLSFNGIYRVNSDGKFNVPYGGNPQKGFDIERIRAVSKALANTKLICSDFAAAVKDAKKGDFVYFDPPYTVAHGNNGFIQYNEKMFSWSDQKRLLNLAKRLADRGCKVIVSNAEHASIKKIYADFKKQKVKRHSGIGALPKTRKHIAEFVFFN